MIGKAANALGWRPKVDIDKGLEATIAYFTLSMETNSREATVASIDSARAARARLPRRRQGRVQSAPVAQAKQEDL